MCNYCESEYNKTILSTKHYPMGQQIIDDPIWVGSGGNANFFTAMKVSISKHTLYSCDGMGTVKNLGHFLNLEGGNYTETKDGVFEINDNDYDCIHINYCPFCGRDLRVEESE